MDSAIRWEFAVGRNGLGPSYSGLFAGEFQRILNKDNVSKTQWLYSIWVARDKFRTDQGLELWPRETVAATFVQRARMRHKRRIDR